MEKAKGGDFIGLTLSTRDFIRTLSQRDILTSFSLALLLAAISDLIDYYSLDDWVNVNSNLLMGIFTLIVLAFNHIFYKLEHKRSNNFIGRILHDCIFLMCFALIGKLKLAIAGDGFSIDLENIGSSVFSLLFLLTVITFYEMTIALFKRVLKLLKWRIL